MSFQKMAIFGVSMLIFVWGVPINKSSAPSISLSFWMTKETSKKPTGRPLKSRCPKGDKLGVASLAGANQADLVKTKRQ